ncbi:DUF6668 family protein [Actinomyces howellii]|uniref:DUF6668 family protein n=1 Tax=Actinomyces howellii TaxID=52771 RepID=UPI000F82F085|nr:DUF6668 family protein [Actinomyces howellii]
MSNPWLTDEPAQSVVAPAGPDRDDRAPVSRSWLPVAEVPAVDGLELVQVGSAGLWLVGAHGGAGTSTVARVLGVAESGTRWPVSDQGLVRAWVVARTHRAGTAAAQRAAVQWAGGGVPGVDLAGVVWVADAPGRLPRPLRRAVDLVSGAFPASVTVPWVGGWREGEADASSVPGQVRRALRAVSADRKED